MTFMWGGGGDGGGSQGRWLPSRLLSQSPLLQDSYSICRREITGYLFNQTSEHFEAMLLDTAIAMNMVNDVIMI